MNHRKQSNHSVKRTDETKRQSRLIIVYMFIPRLSVSEHCAESPRVPPGTFKYIVITEMDQHYYYHKSGRNNRNLLWVVIAE